MCKEQLPQFIQYCEAELTTTKNNFLKAGINLTMAQVLSFGNRTELLQILPRMATLVFNDEPANTLLNQLSVKLTQRIGLVSLKPRVVNWRYKKSRQSLMGTNLSNKENNQDDDDDDDDIEISDIIEEVIERLLNALREKDTIVRWSAAKGIGRVTSRLPMDMGDQIVGNLLELFTPSETDCAWHGGCLALAELSRRGLLLPSRLQTIIPVINTALSYDERRGAHSVGSHVRDAACYVCWAFARAYQPEVMQPYVNQLAAALLRTAVFDRELNCRRAAAAAFQENVGRQGNFSHGIDILTKADYFSLCNRSSAYLEVSYFIAQFPEYCNELIDDLIYNKIIHWDQSIRELASQSLMKLTRLNVNYMQSKLEHLLQQITSTDMNHRHGCLLSLANVLLALHECNYEFSQPEQEMLISVISRIQNKKLYTGRGGELTKEAACRFIECISKSKIKLTKDVIELYKNTLDDCLKHPTITIVNGAVSAMVSFMSTHYPILMEMHRNDILKKYINALKEDDALSVRRGYILLLGNVPDCIISDSSQFESIINVLILRSKVEQEEIHRDADSRSSAIDSLINFVSHSKFFNSTNSSHSSIFQCVVDCSNDYSVDKRGDVGSFVREASMRAIDYLLTQSSSSVPVLSIQQSNALIGILLKQQCEKIDRVRDTAGKVLYRAVNADKTDFVNKLEIKEAIAEGMELIQIQIQDLSNRDPKGSLIDWSSSEITFPIMCRLLNLAPYRYDLLHGLVVSIGGLSSHVFRASADAMISFMKCNQVQVKWIAEDLIELLNQNVDEERVNVPLLKSISHLMSHDCFSCLDGDGEFCDDLIQWITQHLAVTKNVLKITYIVDILCELLKFADPVRSKALGILMGTLVNIFPKVREHASTQLYSTLQVFGDEVLGDDEELLDEVLDFLTSTNWQLKSVQLKPSVQEICAKAGFEFTVIRPPKQDPTKLRKTNRDTFTEVLY
ncbi:tubulin-folding cofactor D [Acrasis kona]|uniref:Tubulin-folding cofactor D n=1 Tax=Acrasis kona TaxID=1008807 RepID=A0AAW2YU39_9EUKA